MTSIVAPPVVIRQKLFDQKYSFQSFCLISGYSFLINLLLADLYAFKNLDNSELGSALKRTWT
jgi:hypothetical protein